MPKRTDEEHKKAVADAAHALSAACKEAYDDGINFELSIATSTIASRMPYKFVHSVRLWRDV